MRVLTVNSDIGCLRIYNKDFAMLFSNNFGDAPFRVVICENLEKNEIKKCARELANNKVIDGNSGMFDVRLEAFLSDHDYVEKPIYTFCEGRWHVTLWNGMTWLIKWTPIPEGQK